MPRSEPQSVLVASLTAHREPPPSEPTSRVRRAWLNRICFLLVAFGFLVRARQYGARRSLWVDEAMITNNLINRTVQGLVHPLANHQGAPLGWLISEKVGIHFAGPNEYGLRLTAFVAGLLVLPLGWWVARRTLPPSLVPLAVAAIVVAPQLIRYSSEVKQYSSDALAVLLIVAVAVELSRVSPGQIGFRWSLVWALAGSFVVTFSHPGVLATGACSIILIVWLVLSHSYRPAIGLTAASTIIALALLVHYELVLKHLSKDQFLKDYWRGGWRDGNPPRPLAASSFVHWLGRAVVGFVHNPLGLVPPLIVGLLFFVGLVALWRRGRLVVLLLTAPLAAQLLASAAGVFPLSGRLVLGYVPIVLLIICAAPALLPRSGRYRLGITAVIIVVLAPSVANAAQKTVHPFRMEELRPVLQTVAREFTPGELLFVHHGADASFGVYGQLGIRLVSNGTMSTARASSCPDKDLLRSAGLSGRRIWFISSHRWSSDPHDVARTRRHLSAAGTILQDVRRPGAEAVLLQLATAMKPSNSPSLDGFCLRLIRTR